jgi:PAS domain S-box-containing protein
VPRRVTTHISAVSNDRLSAGDLVELLHTAVEWLPVGVMMVAPDGAIVLTNRELERQFGYTRAELMGRSVDDLVPDASRPTHTELRRDYGEHPRARPMAAGREVLGRRKDGSELPIEVTLTPTPVRGSLFVIASVLDIASRRQGEEAVEAARDQRSRFETLVSELGAEFINLRADELDRAIEDALARVVRMLDLDRSALFQVADKSGDFIHTHQWTRPGWAPPAPRVSARENFPWHLAQVRNGETVSYSSLDEVPDPVDRENLRRLGTRSGVTVPVTVGGRVWGALTFASVREARGWTPSIINRFRIIALIFASAFARKQADDALRQSLGDVAALRDRLRDENTYLRTELHSLTGAPAIVGHSAAVRRVHEQVRQVGPTESPVLIVGETGTGKTLFATRLHELSARADRALVRVNCASLSATSLEAELFGSDKGAYAAGDLRQVGRLELANHSTVFFDEIADLPLEAQASLSRVLQDKQIHPIGSVRPIKVDVRIIAATRRDLVRGIAAGTFRDDLYYRLNVFTIQIPPLRERPEDIPLLVWRFIDEFSAAYGKPIDAIDKESMAALQRYSWPGNARELRNVVERAMIVGRGRQLRIALPGAETNGRRPDETLTAIEKEHIASILAASNWRIEGRDGAAARLGIAPRTLAAKISRLRIRRPAD